MGKDGSALSKPLYVNGHGDQGHWGGDPRAFSTKRAHTNDVLLNLSTNQQFLLRSGGDNFGIETAVTGSKASRGRCSGPQQVPSLASRLLPRSRPRAHLGNDIFRRVHRKMDGAVAIETSSEGRSSSSMLIMYVNFALILGLYPFRVQPIYILTVIHSVPFKVRRLMKQGMCILYYTVQLA